MGVGLRTGKLTRFEAAAFILQPKTVVDSEITGVFLTETSGKLAVTDLNAWLAGARNTTNAGTKYATISAFAAVAANRP